MNVCCQESVSTYRHITAEVEAITIYHIVIMFLRLKLKYKSLKTKQSIKSKILSIIKWYYEIGFCIYTAIHFHVACVYMCGGNFKLSVCLGHLLVNSII